VQTKSKQFVIIGRLPFYLSKFYLLFLPGFINNVKTHSKHNSDIKNKFIDKTSFEMPRSNIFPDESAEL
jgi:hypothetical protein